ncbi:MAG: extracellular solute-binding protein [Anaerolineales bacterium]
MIERDIPIPLHYQLKTLIKRQIDSGTLQPGDRLPTEQELCQRYQVSRTPVRQALTALVQEGIIYRRAGVGTFVTRDHEAVMERPQLACMSSEARSMKLLKTAVAEWNQEHPHRDLTLDNRLCPRSALQQQFNQLLVQGEAPDIVELEDVWLADYVHSASITPLSELNAAWTAGLVEILEPTVYRSQVLGGELFGLPLQTEITGLWIRRDWLAAADLALPTTWEELYRVLDYFNQATSKWRFGHRYALAFPAGTAAGTATVNALLPVLWSTGGRLLTPDGQLALADPAVYDALVFLHSLVERRYVPPEGSEWQASDPPRMLARGEVPLILGGTYDWPVIESVSGWAKEETLPAQLCFCPLPRPTPETSPVAAVMGTSWSITRQSDLQREGLQLLQAIVDGEWLANFYVGALHISPFRTLNDQLVERYPWMDELVRLLRAARPRPQMRQYGRVSRFLQQMFEEILWQDAPLKATINRTHHYLSLLLQD